MSVSQTSASIPQADLVASTRRRSAVSGSLPRSGARVPSSQPIARSWRRRSCSTASPKRPRHRPEHSRSWRRSAAAFAQGNSALDRLCRARDLDPKRRAPRTLHDYPSGPAGRGGSILAGAGLEAHARVGRARPSALDARLRLTRKDQSDAAARPMRHREDGRCLGKQGHRKLPTVAVEGIPRTPRSPAGEQDRQRPDLDVAALDRRRTRPALPTRHHRRGRNPSALRARRSGTTAAGKRQQADHRETPHQHQYIAEADSVPRPGQRGVVKVVRRRSGAIR